MASTNHKHTGSDGSEKLDRENEFTVSCVLVGALSATAANYTTFWNVPYPCDLIGVQESHAVAGSDGGAVTVNLERLRATEAPGAGDDLITALSLKATANTVVDGVLTATREHRQLLKGHRFALVLTGTPTDVTTLAVTLKLKKR